MRILLVEDERALAAALVKLLQDDGYAVDHIADGTIGREYALTGIYDALILDVMLPGIDGFELLRSVRNAGLHTPVMMLTARSGVEDRVRGLESGADYYLPKPFHTQELLACLRTILRRGGEPVRPMPLFGNTELDPSEQCLKCTDGASVKLSAREFQLMDQLIHNPNQLITKEVLFDRVWGLDSDAEYNSVEVYISFLRKKLAFIGSDLIIRVKRGAGYILEVNK